MSDEAPASLEELRAEISQLRERVYQVALHMIVLDIVMTSSIARGGDASEIATDLRTLSGVLGARSAINIDPILRGLLDQLSEFDRDTAIEDCKVKIDIVEKQYRDIADLKRRG